MSDTAFDRILKALADDGRPVRHHRDGHARTRCPGHNGAADDSLSITRIEDRTLIHCHAACASKDVVAALGQTMADLYDNRKGAEYLYDDGRRVHRTAGKRFHQSGNTRGKPTLFRLSKVKAAVKAGRPVWVTEGEQDVLSLESLGAVATTSPQGAANWRKVDPSPLHGATVILVPDDDEPGRRFARDVLATLDGKATVRVVKAKTGKDATDHVAAGHGLDDFELVDLDAADTGLYVDIGALLDGGLPDPPAAELLYRDDGHALFYAGQVNVVFGDPESGKTLLVQAAAAEALKADRQVLVVDLDHNGPESTVYRFLDMDVPEKVLRDPLAFRYVEPTDRDHLRAVIDDAKQWRPAVAVVDSVGELLPMLGLNSNSPDDFTIANTAVLKPLAMAGAAVLAIDHLPKNRETRASGQTGTLAKKRAIGGVSLRLTINEPFAPGRKGSAWLAVSKDRHGGLRRHCPTEGKEPPAGLFILDGTGHRITYSIKAPEMGDAAKMANVSEDDLAALGQLDPPPKSVRDVRDRLKWRTERAADVLREWRSRNASGKQGTVFTPSGQGGKRSGKTTEKPQVSDVSRSRTHSEGNGNGGIRDCDACGEPMDIIEDGQTTHPCCEDPPAPGEGPIDIKRVE